MIDALLQAVKDAVRGAGFGWDQKTCEIMADEHPPARCGDWFASVHQLAAKSTMMNALNEYFGYAVTVTRRITVPLDRVGDQVLSPALVRTLARETGFNARAEQIRAFLHMNWAVIRDANQLMVSWVPDGVVHGFCEPAHYVSPEKPAGVGPEWFSAEPDASELGIKQTLTFDGARRLQPIGGYL